MLNPKRPKHDGLVIIQKMDKGMLRVAKPFWELWMVSLGAALRARSGSTLTVFLELQFGTSHSLFGRERFDHWASKVFGIDHHHCNNHDKEVTCRATHALSEIEGAIPCQTHEIANDKRLTMIQTMREIGCE